jgi:hypothetical protein
MRASGMPICDPVFPSPDELTGQPRAVARIPRESGTKSPLSSNRQATAECDKALVALARLLGRLAAKQLCIGAPAAILELEAGDGRKL